MILLISVIQSSPVATTNHSWTFLDCQ